MVKVQITNKVNSYFFNGKRYIAGDIVEVPADKVVSAFMEVQPEPVVVPIFEQEQTEEELVACSEYLVTNEPPTITASMVEEAKLTAEDFKEPKPKRVRKKVDA